MPLSFMLQVQLQVQLQIRMNLTVLMLLLLPQGHRRPWVQKGEIHLKTCGLRPLGPRAPGIRDRLAPTDGPHRLAPQIFCAHGALDFFARAPPARLSSRRKCDIPRLGRWGAPGGDKRTHSVTRP